MADRTVTVKAGEGSERLTIVIEGCPCIVPDLQMLVVAYLREQVRQHQTHPKNSARRPCGCKDTK